MCALDQQYLKAAAAAASCAQSEIAEFLRKAFQDDAGTRRC